MFILSTLLLLGGGAIDAASQTWTQVNYEEDGAQYIVSLSFSESISAPTALQLDQGVPRLVLDWPTLSEDVAGEKIGGGQSMLSGQGGVSRIRYAKRGDSGLRIVLELAPNVSLGGYQHLGTEFRLHMSVPHENSQERQSSTIVERQSDPDRLSYDVPAPRLKPNLNRPTPHLLTPSTPLTSLHSSAPNTFVSLEIYTPKKRLFSGRDIPYPRVAPHLGVQVGRAESPVTQAIAPPRKPVIVIDPGHGGYDLSLIHI